MKGTPKLFLLTILYAAATLLHLALWTRYEALFPSYPEGFVRLIFNLCSFGRSYCGQENLEDLYFLIGSMINVAIIGLILYLILRLTKKR